MAWLGTLCQTSSSRQSGSYVSGTGISTAQTTEWSLVAHEIGHGFGAIHDCTNGCSLSGNCCPYSSGSCNAGGRFIMNPTTSSSETRFSGCTLGNICTCIDPGGESRKMGETDARRVGRLEPRQSGGNNYVYSESRKSDRYQSLAVR